MEDNKISLEFKSKKSVSCIVCTLEVPNFFTLPEYKDNDFEINSPPFEFESATWCFRCCPEKNSNVGFNIYILRLNTEIPNHHLLYKLALLNANNVQCCESPTYYDEIEESLKPCHLYQFKNDSSFHDGCNTLTLIVHLFMFETTEKMLETTVDAKLPSSIKDYSHTLPVEVKNRKTSLTSTKKTGSADFYSLNLPNVFNTPTEDLSCPTFTFSNATCCLHFCSNTGRYIDFNFEVLNSEKPLGKTYMKWTVIDSNDKIIDRDFRKLDFTKLSQIIKTNFFKNSESPFFTMQVHLFREEDLEIYVPIVRATDFDSLSLDFKRLFLDGINSDLTLKVAEKEFRVHSSILMTRSPVFEAMLRYDMIEKNKGIIEIPDIDAQAMELLLIFIYSGEVDSLKEDNVLGVYYAADKYNMAFLKKQCSEFMKKSLSPSIICDVIQLALNHDDRDLLECCTEYFVNHISDIFPTVEWKSFMKANPIAANELLIKTTKKWNCPKS